MQSEDGELQKDADSEAEGGPDPEGYAGTITAEEGALACPIIRLDHGISACLSTGCVLWIPEGDGLPADCGFKFLALYARMEMARMSRYQEMAE